MRRLTDDIVLLLGSWIDAGIRGWVRVLGLPFRRDETPWLNGPVGPRAGVGAGFYDLLAAESGLEVRRGNPDVGLVPDFSALRGPDFDPARLHPLVIDFYEHTARYHLDAWSQWSPLFRALGWILTTFVSRRISQLNLPASPLDMSRRMTSEIIRLADGKTGATAHVGWLRTMQATGTVLYAGFYTTARPPGATGPCVMVAFPLPRGNATVILRPEAQPDGSLKLLSSGGGFGGPGFYRVLENGPGAFRARYIRAMKQVIHVFVDGQGVLRTEHVFQFFNWEILRLHYKITPDASRPPGRG